ncbi:hypothetical protein [Actinomyces urogenitalis]|uniref:hypothetical protein n=1 Tax=Actinomyces urogenitalis TaxID=103621 RepID=UPI00243291DB|nr:hypothetical protein [Actinomyces urogenitalis]MCI7456793.1 glycosyltransferase family 39 protein [Actinomyces urogenitalis]
MSLLWVVVSAVVAFRFIAAHQAFSYQDEYTYLDYIDKAAHGVLLRRNMLIDPYTANELACRGMERFGPIVSGCGGTVNYDDLPIDGFSTGTIHSPVYFYVAALLTKPMTAFAGATMFTAARMTGAVFLGLGIAVLWVLMKELGASRSVALAGSLLLLVSPQTWWSNFYITPDAVNILAGATILLAALQMVRGRWSPVWFVLASIFFALVKFQGVFAAGAALVFITAYAIFGNSRRGLRRSWLAWGIGGTILALAAQFGWQWLRMRLSLPDPPNSTYVLDEPAPFRLEHALNQVGAFILNLYLGPSGHLEGQREYHGYVLLAAVLLAASLVAAALLNVAISRERRVFMQSMLASLLLVGPAFYAYVALSSDTAFPLLPRYGGALVPALYVGLGPVVDKPWQKRVLLCLAVVVVLLALHYNVAY